MNSTLNRPTLKDFGPLTSRVKSSVERPAMGVQGRSPANIPPPGIVREGDKGGGNDAPPVIDEEIDAASAAADAAVDGMAPESFLNADERREHTLRSLDKTLSKIAPAKKSAPVESILVTQADRIEAACSKLNPALRVFIEDELKGRFVGVASLCGGKD
jgi:hypothetical protein